MSPRNALLAVSLGALGIFAAAAIAIAANRITGESVGLSAEPVSVVPAGSTPQPRPARALERGEEKDDRSGDDVTTASGDDDASTGDSSGPGPEGSEREGSSGSGGGGSGSGERTPEAGDDSGGSGSGSSGSGSGSSSGSGSGSGGSGSGSGDPADGSEPEDD